MKDVKYHCYTDTGTPSLCNWRERRLETGLAIAIVIKIMGSDEALRPAAKV
jgi:hypothetical protein